MYFFYITIVSMFFLEKMNNWTPIRAGVLLCVWSDHPGPFLSHPVLRSSRYHWKSKRNDHYAGWSDWKTWTWEDPKDRKPKEVREDRQLGTQKKERRGIWRGFSGISWDGNHPVAKVGCCKMISTGNSGLMQNPSPRFLGGGCLRRWEQAYDSPIMKGQGSLAT